MLDEKPYPDMTDRGALEKLLEIAMSLLEFNKDDKCYKWGNTLYDIHKYLEDRLTDNQEIEAKNIESVRGETIVIHNTGTININSQ